MKIKIKNRFLGTFVTLILLLLIFFSGPATAFDLILNIPTIKNIDEKTDFEILIRIFPTERIPIKNITLTIAQPEINYKILCYYDSSFVCFKNGKLTNEINLSLSKIGVDYGYGYGYGVWEGYGYYFGYGYGYGYGYTTGFGSLKISGIWKTPLTPALYTITAKIVADNYEFLNSTQILVKSSFEKIVNLTKPKIVETKNVTAGISEISVGNERVGKVEIKVNATTDTTIKLAVFENRTIIPKNVSKKKPIKYFELETTNVSWVLIKIYYKEEEIKEIKEESLRIYRWNETKAEWELIPGGVNTEENYVWGNITHFSIFGIFGEPEAIEKEEKVGTHLPIPKLAIKLITPREIIQETGTEKEHKFTIYNFGNVWLKVWFNAEGINKEWIKLPEEIILNVNETKALSFTLKLPENAKNTTFKLIAFGKYETYTVKNESKIDLVVIKPKPTPKPTPPEKKPVCGNGICEPGEDWRNCPQDCAKPPEKPICGNGICEVGEDWRTCPEDCPKPKGTMEIIIEIIKKILPYIIVLLIVIVILLYILKKR